MAKRSYEYKAKCTACEKKTEHFSGLCVNCRAFKCKRCKKPFRQKVNGVALCHACRTELGEHVWHDDLVNQDLWVH